MIVWSRMPTASTRPSAKTKKSAGVGVRILLPMVGLMGIDWAYGFQKYDSYGSKIGGSQFHFVIGQEF